MKNENSVPLRFFAIAFGWSWLLWGFAIIGARGLVLFPMAKSFPFIMSVMVLGAFGPAVAALLSIVSLREEGGVRAFLKKFLDLRFGLVAWIVPPFVLLACTLVAWLIPEYFGLKRAAMLLPNIVIFPLYWLVMVLFGGGQEEIGWRAYIMPKLEARFGFWKGTLLLGLIWALWHLPLWLLPGTSQTYMNFGGFMMLTVGYSFLFSWAMKKGGYRPLLGLIMHGTANSLIPVFPILIMQQGAAQPRFWLWVSLTLASGILIAVLHASAQGKQNVALS